MCAAWKYTPSADFFGEIWKNVEIEEKIVEVLKLVNEHVKIAYSLNKISVNLEKMHTAWKKILECGIFLSNNGKHAYFP